MSPVLKSKSVPGSGTMEAWTDTAWRVAVPLLPDEAKVIVSVPKLTGVKFVLPQSVPEDP